MHKTAKDHRESVLSKLDTYLMGVYENIEMQPESREQEAFLTLIMNVGKLISTMREAKGDSQFVQAVGIIDGLMEKEFFSKIYGPRGEDNDVIKAVKEAGMGAIGVKKGPNGAEIDLIGITDPNQIPLEVRRQLKQVLMGLGVKEQEASKQLGLL